LCTEWFIIQKSNFPCMHNDQETALNDPNMEDPATWLDHHGSARERISQALAEQQSHRSKPSA
ncbi:MAG TPA: hypothetical protein VK910_12630, partial [Thiobacillus sp.]|nr:hypothetical protein [Thiobacillus sp.]